MAEKILCVLSVQKYRLELRIEWCWVIGFTPRWKDSLRSNAGVTSKFVSKLMNLTKFKRTQENLGELLYDVNRFFFVRCVFGAVCESATLHDSNGRKGCLVRTDTWPTKYCNFRVYTKRNIQIAANSLKINRFGMFLDFSANISTAETLGWRWRCKILFTLECSYLNNRTHLGVTDVNIQRKPRHFIDG